MKKNRAFTLIELLVVIAIIALLIGILLPALGAARSTARSTLSLANQRGIVQALSIYAADNDGDYPINVAVGDTGTGGDLGLFEGDEPIRRRAWFDESIIGDILPNTESGDVGEVVSDDGLPPTVGGGVMQDPNHERAGRSYSMNYWASSIASFGPRNPASFNTTNGLRRPGAVFRAFPDREQAFTQWSSGEGPGIGFDSTVEFASSVMLISGAWGQFVQNNELSGDTNVQGNNSDDARAFAIETLGRYHLPGERFGEQGNTIVDPMNLVDIPFGDFGEDALGFTQELDNPVADQGVDDIFSYIPYYRHPARSDDFQSLDGDAQFGFVDGSVRAIDYNELVDPIDGGPDVRSSYEVLWSPRDEQFEVNLLGRNN